MATLTTEYKFLINAKEEKSMDLGLKEYEHSFGISGTLMDTEANSVYSLKETLVATSTFFDMSSVSSVLEADIFAKALFICVRNLTTTPGKVLNVLTEMNFSGSDAYIRKVYPGGMIIMTSPIDGSTALNFTLDSGSDTISYELIAIGNDTV